MKKIFSPLFLILSICFVGCIKNNPVTSSDSKVEYDAATWNSNALGVTYPIMSVVPNFGAAGGSPSITRTLSTFRIRVNLLGEQKTAATAFNYKVASESTAAAGVHFTALSGVGSIPANSSYGFIDINLLNPGVSSPTPVVLVIELISNDIVASNINYGKIGFNISQL